MRTTTKFAIVLLAALTPIAGLSIATAAGDPSSATPFLTEAEGDDRYVQRAWAEVQRFGGVVRSSGPVSLTVTSDPWRFRLDFGFDVSSCSAIAGLAGGRTPSGHFHSPGSVSALALTDEVEVATFNAAGDSAPHDFTVQVLC